MLAAVAFVEYKQKQALYFDYGTDYGYTGVYDIFWRCTLQMRTAFAARAELCISTQYDRFAIRDDKKAVL